MEELHSNKYNISDVGEIYLEILDTSGTFEFPAMRQLSIEKGDAFILVFSVNDEASWQEVVHLRQMILDHKGEGKMPKQKQPTSEETRSRNFNTNANSDADDEQQQQPISSIYAAATKLTSMQRRASCVTPSQKCTRLASLNLQQGANVNQDGSAMSINAAARRRLSVCSPTNAQAEGLVLRNNLHQSPMRAQPDSSNGRQSTPISCSPSSAHYNSQLSRLIQLAPVSDTSGKLGLLESGNSLDEQQEPISPINKELNGQKFTDNNNNNINNNIGNNRQTALAYGSSTSASINKRGVTKRTVSMAQNSSASKMHHNQNAKNLLRNNNNYNENSLEQDFGNIFKRTTTPIVVAANKCDLPQNEWLVDLEEAERLVCQVWGHSFVRCSAKEAQNTDKVFRELLRQAQAPPNLSESVIDDNQLRRQSLPVLKNQLSVSQMKGLRNLYNLHQKGSTSQQVDQNTTTTTTTSPHTNTTMASTTSSSQANYQAKLSSSKKQYQNSFTNYNSNQSAQSSSSSSADSTSHHQQIESTLFNKNQIQQAIDKPTSQSQSQAAHRVGSAMGARSASSASDDSQCIIS